MFSQKCITMTRGLACSLNGGIRRFSSASGAGMEGIKKLRNLIICAHIDAGKSTLSDRLLQVTDTVPEAVLATRAQYLDSNPIEMERQITIKARAARMKWKDHLITIVDCPGHHDFSRQVTQSASAVEGALLLVDATQGVQAQTLASVEIALEEDLELVPVINKIDLPTAEVELAKEQIESLIGIDASDAILTSAKQNIGTESVLDAIVERIPAPLGSIDEPLQALVFDSYYDSYRGVVVLIRVVNGSITPGDHVRTMSQGSNRLANTVQSFHVDSVGFLSPHETSCARLLAGDIGFFTASIKRTGDIPVGETVTHCGPRGSTKVLPGYRESKPVVFCGLFPSNADDFGNLRTALEKLQLQDSSLIFEPDNSAALGAGFRCGFLGLLHMSVTQERLEREFDVDVITSAPSVSYNILVDKDGEWRSVSNPSAIPDGHVRIQEPYASVDIICSEEHVGTLMELSQSRRGELVDQRYIGLGKVKLAYKIPLSEVITDFHDSVKSRSRGFASLDYVVDSMRESKLQRMDVIVAGTMVDGLSCVVHRDRAAAQGRWLVERLRKVIPRQMFKVAIQAAAGGKIVASEHIAPFRKDVTAKCYGGDASRKKKLLKKQAEGKKRMKSVGNVSIPQEAFLAILSRQDD